MANRDSNRARPASNVTMMTNDDTTVSNSNVFNRNSGVGYAVRFNNWIATTFVGRHFRLTGCGHPKERRNARFSTDFMAGLTTFFAMAYIISVNATILTDSGGPCECATGKGTCIDNPDYLQCLAEIKRDFITGTAAISALTTFAMGLFANIPIALGPGMGLNAYFTYTVVGYHGSGPVPYALALTAIFVEGFIFVGLSICGLRQWLARIIPPSIKLASGVGIGLYLTLIGMTYSAGIGVITGGTSTPLELAGCYETYRGLDGICPTASKMRSGTTWIGIFIGGFMTAILIAFRCKGAIMIGIILTSVISWPRNTPLTYFPHSPVGDDNFNFFKKVVSFHPITQTLNVNQWNISGNVGQFWLALITFLYVDIMDCTGTLYSMARFAGAMDDKTQDFEGSGAAYCVDALGISFGSLMGISPVTAFVESGAGIAAGGRTGITSLVTGFCFFISIFFAPIFASFPPWATGSTLILVGCMMCAAAKDINWKYVGDSLPAFITLAMMPFTYSIAYGLIAGIITYTLVNGGIALVMWASRGKFRPTNFKHKEPWTWKPAGGFFPPWVQDLYKWAWGEKTIVISEPEGLEMENKDRAVVMSSDESAMDVSMSHVPIVIHNASGEKSSSS